VGPRVEVVLMGPVLGQILPYALGVALTPTAIIAVILMLFSARARQNGLAFLAGWVIAMTAILLIVLGASSTAGASSGTPSTLASVIVAALGVLLLVLGFRTWRSRPATGVSAPMPKWMATIDSLEPGRAFLIGALYTGVSPKSLALIAAAGLAIAQAGLEAREQTVAVLEFVIIASLTILVPVLYSLLGGDKARATLDGWKSWLVTNNATVVAVILLLLGAVLIGDGTGALIG
jgi:hypothetical protein